MKVINKKLVSMLCIVMVIISIGIFLICPKDTEKTTLDEVKLKEPEKESGMFAIMVQEEANSENYTLYDKESWPTEGYIFNQEKSGCLDNDGQKITDVQLSYRDGKVTVETGNTSYCYIYFDLVPLKTAAEYLKEQKPNGLSEDVSTGLRRFQGTTNVENYICFGDTTCNSGDNHMYRIIGIETTTGRLKIMKETSIGNNAWDSNYDQDIKWDTSELKTKLNGSEFLDNTSTYIPSDWKTLIDDTIQWKYGDVTSVSTTGTSLYSTEQSWQDTVTARVGLIYLSDYYLSYNDTINCSSDYSTCKTSWMHQTNNGGSSSEYQWTMSRYGDNGDYYNAWFVISNGIASWTDMGGTYAVRPVFYLKSDVKITGGDGKKGTPFTITL